MTKCVYCGGPVDWHCKLGPGYCFTCYCWWDYYAIGGQKAVIIDGHHYMIGDEAGSRGSGSRGYGGSKFIIEFFDGRVVTTTNLWSQGKIPDNFLHLFPNNAKFKEV